MLAQFTSILGGGIPVGHKVCSSAGRGNVKAPEPLISQCNGDWTPALRKDHKWVFARTLYVTWNTSTATWRSAPTCQAPEAFLAARAALVVKSQPPTTKFPERNLRDDSSPQTFIVGDFRISDFSHLSIGTQKIPYIFCAFRVVFNDSGFAMNVPFKNHTFGGVWNQISETTVWVV